MIATRVTADRAESSNYVVAAWLLICCALVFVMVVLGGVTRLTGSGLSMVDWRPVTGILPPLSGEQWQASFELYQSSPEFKEINFEMSVDDFKNIFWLEYLHRLLGRVIGLVFFLPLIFFTWTGRIKKAEFPKYGLMFVLGGLQGLLGWYMVKSGLVNDPHVSQYRLTAHLLAAILIYAYMFWIAMSLLFKHAGEARHRLYPKTMALLGLVTLTVISGGFVAGLKAGLAYNTFPMMGNRWVPEGMLVFSPLWRNFFDNLVTVQFNHRVLALTSLLLVVIYWVFARREQLPERIRPAIHALPVVALIQVTLGIWTLLLQVPVALAASHQAVALLLFTVVLYLCHGLKGVR
jgi:cytochrome c oxidase assembly protein subunit 15